MSNNENRVTNFIPGSPEGNAFARDERSAAVAPDPQASTKPRTSTAPPNIDTALTNIAQAPPDNETAQKMPTLSVDTLTLDPDVSPLAYQYVAGLLPVGQNIVARLSRASGSLGSASEYLQALRIKAAYDDRSAGKAQQARWQSQDAEIDKVFW
jgi:hypothetical protein